MILFNVLSLLSCADQSTKVLNSSTNLSNLRSRSMIAWNSDTLTTKTKIHTHCKNKCAYLFLKVKSTITKTSAESPHIVT